jgi:predicted DNA-binding transcriptional regulator YafY
VKRAERLHALIEEIRRRAPTPVSAAWLAERLEVSRRTVERDLAALRDAGVPLWSDVGRRGGTALHPKAVLPPLNLTATETTAMLTALTMTDGMPYTQAARAGAAKLRALLPPTTAVAVDTLCQHIRVEIPSRPDVERRVMNVIEDGVATSTIVRIRYQDRNGTVTRRDIEPVGFYGTRDGWAVAGWCRLRNDSRLFRLDRIQAAQATREVVAPRDLDEVLGWVPGPTTAPQ